MSSMDKRIKQMLKPKKGKAGSRPMHPHNTIPEVSQSFTEIINLKKEIIKVLTPFARFRVPTPVVLVGENGISLESKYQASEDIHLSSSLFSDFEEGLVLELFSPEEVALKVQESERPVAVSSRLSDCLNKMPQTKFNKLPVTLTLPIASKQTKRPRETPATEVFKNANSHEASSPVLAPRHHPVEPSVSSPKRAKYTLSTKAMAPRVAAKDSFPATRQPVQLIANKEATCSAYKPSAIPVYNREISQRPIDSRVREPLHPNKPSQIPRPQEGSHTFPSGDTSKNNIRSQEDKHPLPLGNTSRDITLPQATHVQDSRTCRSTAPQAQRPLPQTPNTSRASNNLTTRPLKRACVETAQRPNRKRFVYSSSVGTIKARAATAVLNAPVVKREDYFFDHRPNTFINPIIVPGAPLPLPVVPALPGVLSDPPPSKGYLANLRSHQAKYTKTAMELYCISKKRSPQQNETFYLTVVESVLWYVKAFHYAELLEKSPSEIIQKWGDLLTAIQSCLDQFHTFLDCAPILGVLRYSKCLVYSRIAEAMGLVLTNSPKTVPGMAEKYYYIQEQANKAFVIASSTLSASHVREAFPELYNYFSSKAFAGFPPLRPPKDDTANFVYFARYIIDSYLLSRNLDPVAFHEDDLPALNLDFLDPHA